MPGFPGGGFIYRRINHYNFLSRPRKNVNGWIAFLGCLSKRETLNFLRTGLAHPIRRNIGRAGLIKIFLEAGYRDSLSLYFSSLVPEMLRDVRIEH